ncbi:MAG: PIN domain-containing protein [Gammaproteobacteria bacterium]|nr:PIN domain-containing protein [Gammaproteobacteria bacterium]
MVFDTNILIYAVDEASPFHDRCREDLLQACKDPSPAFLTWNICYEFLRATTHPRVFNNPWTSKNAWIFLETILASPGFELLTATQRHGSVLSRTLEELTDISGNLFHDLHTAVLMREHGVSRICTRDTDFHRFPFVTVIDPLRQ